MTTRKTVALTTDLCWQSDVFAFQYTVQICHIFPSKEQASYNFMAAVSICNDFGVQDKKICQCFPPFPFYLSWSDVSVCHDLSFLNIEFQVSFFTLLFHCHQKVLQFFLTFCHYRGIICILRLLIFLLAILIPAYDSSSPAFHIMYSAYELNKQEDNIQPYCIPFWILNQSVVLCLVLTTASWLTHKFLRDR